jgi:hypothetical protein
MSAAIRLADDQLDALADRIAARLRTSPTSDSGLVDAQQLAAHLGVARSFVYTHSDDLGGKRLGGKGRLRFDLEEAVAAFASSEPERTAPAPRRRKRAVNGNVGSILKVRG